MTVAEHVPADPAYPRFLCSRDEPVLLNSTWPIRFSCFRVREYPVFGLCQRSQPRLMLTKSLRKRTVKRHPSVRGLCFYVPLHPVDVGLSYFQAQSLPIDIIPSQTEDLAYSQSQAHRHNAHGSERFGNVLKHSTKLVHGKCLRFLLPFRAVFHADKAHGI